MYSFLSRLPDPEAEARLFWDSRIDRIFPWYINRRRDDDLVISASPDFLIGEACRRLGIRPENSLAAGDSENDLSMLQAAATGILMRNGAEMNPYLKEGADLVTEYDNDRDGLARTLASILDRIDA